jgi:hypothetical protein
VLRVRSVERPRIEERPKKVTDLVESDLRGGSDLKEIG